MGSGRALRRSSSRPGDAEPRGAHAGEVVADMLRPGIAVPVCSPSAGAGWGRGRLALDAAPGFRRRRGRRAAAALAALRRAASPAGAVDSASRRRRSRRWARAGVTRSEKRAAADRIGGTSGTLPGWASSWRASPGAARAPRASSRRPGLRQQRDHRRPRPAAGAPRCTTSATRPAARARVRAPPACRLSKRRPRRRGAGAAAASRL